MIYAITDIETTGGQPSGNSIVEVGVVLWDGQNVIEEFHSLIDPGIPIPFFITRLTGITNEMSRLGMTSFNRNVLFVMSKSRMNYI